MNSKLSLALVVVAAVAGLALAQVPQSQDPLERLNALSKEVEALKGEVAQLRKDPGSADVGAELAKLRGTVETLAQWSRAQARAATALQDALDEARSKGFTAGINPESRETLLAGFAELTTSLKTGAPEAEPAPQPVKPAPPAPRSRAKQ